MNAIVTERHFGTNFRRKWNKVDGPSNSLIDTLGFTGLRWPGGAITETDFWPEGTFNREGDVSLVTTESFNYGLAAFGAEADEVFRMAQAKGIRVILVVPTFIHKHSRFPEVVAAVKRLISLYHPMISYIEIGNENGHANRTTPHYIQAANIWLETLYAEPVKIAVQVWPGFTDLDLTETKQVINGIRPDLRSRVDASVAHLYVQWHLDPDGTPSNNYRKDWEITRLDAFGPQDGYDRRISRLVTEWGVSPGDMTGHEAAPALVRHFDRLLYNGADELWIWPGTDRAGAGSSNATTGSWNSAGTPFVTPTGVAFQKLRSMVGLRRISGTMDDWQNTLVYAGAGKAVAILINQAETTVLMSPPDIRPYIDGPSRVTVESVGWAQNPLVYQKETNESGAALGTLDALPDWTGGAVSVPPAGLLFLTARAE